jgi:hypothetical protein
MASVETRYAQRDNRVEAVTVTGNLINNGTIDTPGIEKPAYAAIDLTKAQNFTIDTRVLTLRTDVGGVGIEYLLRIYIEPTKPPLYYQNFEWTIFVTLPIYVADKWIEIEIYSSKAEAESGNDNWICSLSNSDLNGVVTESEGTVAITMQLVNNKYILKSVSPQLYYG